MVHTLWEEVRWPESLHFPSSPVHGGGLLSVLCIHLYQYLSGCYYVVDRLPFTVAAWSVGSVSWKALALGNNSGGTSLNTVAMFPIDVI